MRRYLRYVRQGKNRPFRRRWKVHCVTIHSWVIHYLTNRMLADQPLATLFSASHPSHEALPYFVAIDGKGQCQANTKTFPFPLY